MEQKDSSELLRHDLAIEIIDIVRAYNIDELAIAAIENDGFIIDKIGDNYGQRHKLIATLKDLEWRLEVLQNHKDITPKFSNYIKEYMLTPDFANLMAEIRKEEENNEKT